MRRNCTQSKALFGKFQSRSTSNETTARVNINFLRNRYFIIFVFVRATPPEITRKTRLGDVQKTRLQSNAWFIQFNLLLLTRHTTQHDHETVQTNLTIQIVIDDENEKAISTDPIFWITSGRIGRNKRSVQGRLLIRGLPRFLRIRWCYLEEKKSRWHFSTVIGHVIHSVLFYVLVLVPINPRLNREKTSPDVGGWTHRYVPF